MVSYCLVCFLWPQLKIQYQRGEQCESTINILCDSFSNMWTVNFLMFKLVLEKVEEPEIKLPTSAGSWKKQERSRKNIYFCFIDYAKAFDCSLFLMILSSGGSPFLQEPVHAWEFCFVDFIHLFGQLPMCLRLTGALVDSSLKLLIWFSFSYLMYQSQLFNFLFLCCWPGQFSHRTENPSNTHIYMTLFFIFSRLLTKHNYYFQFYVFLA